MEKSRVGQNEAEIKGILALDFGKSKIGMAIADSETRMAFALGVLENNPEFLQKLQEIIKERNVEMIVIGLTKHENDAESSQEKIEFAKMIEKETGIAPIFQDEMFTTKMAQENIKESGQKNIADKDDQEAARIILQDWLDNNSL